MTVGMKPSAAVVVDSTLVRMLLDEQHPDLTELALDEVGGGWDNQLYRLGPTLAVRLPRREVAASLVRHEHQWLPVLAPSLPLPIPVPIRIGVPGCGYPWYWTVVPWLDGTPGVETVTDATALARDLGAFLCALHRPASPAAPSNPWRGVPLRQRAPALVDGLTRIDGDGVDTHAIRRAWDRLVQAPPWAGVPLWIHGDLHPDNLLLRGGRLSSVLDFGDLTAGDPATDLAVAWMACSASTRSTFRDAARNADSPIDEDTWTRAQGWALALGVAYLAQSRGDARLRALGLGTIKAVLGEVSESTRL